MQGESQDTQLRICSKLGLCRRGLIREIFCLMPEEILNWTERKKKKKRYFCKTLKPQKKPSHDAFATGSINIYSIIQGNLVQFSVYCGITSLGINQKGNSVCVHMNECDST